MNIPQPIENIGEGWTLGLIDRVYRLNNGEFNVTADLVEKEIRSLGGTFDNVHVRAVLGRFYRMHMGLE